MRGVWLVVLAGCGRIAFDPLETATADAFDTCAAERVDLGPWNPPVAMTAVNSPGDGDDDPTVRADELELIFTSRRPGGLGGNDVWRTVRATQTDPWGPDTRVVELSTTFDENTPELSPDGLTLWFVSNRPGGVGGEDIWVTTRPDLASAWTPPTNVTALNSVNLDRAPSVFDQGRAILFHSGRPGGPGNQDFWVARRASTSDAWSPPTVLGPPNTPNEEIRGWMSPCGLELVFQAPRAGPGTMDFYVVRRDSTAEPFGPETRIDELSSPAYDQDLRLSADRRHAYFSSDRSGDYELYETKR